MADHTFRKLSVLMPVFNERFTLEAIVERVLTSPVGLELELVIVDDCSSDGSSQLMDRLAARDSRIKVIHQPKNGGKGTAIRTAIAHMTGDIAVVQDADLEYDPHEFPALVQPILDDRADAVFGSRYAGNARKVPGFWHTQVNRFLTFASNVLNNLVLTDMETCYKVVRADVLKQLRLRSATFTLEPELTSRLAQWGARIYEVPISYAGRSFLEGKKIRPIDGVKAIGEMLRCRFIDRRFTDNEHFAALKTCDAARGAQRWVWEQIREHVGNRVLHVDGGVGSLSGHFLSRERLIVAESDAVCGGQLQHRFARRANLSIDPGALDNTFNVERWRRERIDTVLWADWLGRGLGGEFIERCADLLPENGQLIAFLPVASNESDRLVKDRLAERGFDTIVVRSLARLPRFCGARVGAWFDSLSPARRLSWVNRLLPLLQRSDRVCQGPALFEVIVARRRAAQASRLAA